MSTVGSLVQNSVQMLGYTDRYGTPDSEQYANLYKASLVFVNMIVSDLAKIEGITYVPHTSEDDELYLSQITIDDIAPYGLAMWLAQLNNDGDNQALFASLYNQKRALTPHPKHTITKTFPVRSIYDVPTI